MSYESLGGLADHPEVNGFVSDLRVTGDVIRSGQPQVTERLQGVSYGPETHDPEAIAFLDDVMNRIDRLMASGAFGDSPEPRWREDMEEVDLPQGTTRIGVKSIDLPKDGDLDHVLIPRDRSATFMDWWEKTKSEVREEFGQSGQAWREMLHSLKHDALMVPEGESVSDYLASVLPALGDDLRKGTAATVEAIESIADQLNVSPRRIVAAVVSVGILASAIAVSSQGETDISLTPETGAQEIVVGYDETSAYIKFDAAGQDLEQSRFAAAEAAGVSVEAVEFDQESETLRFTDPALLNNEARDRIIAGAVAATAPDVTAQEASPAVTTPEVSDVISPEVLAVNEALVEIKPGQNNNLDTLVEAVKRMDVAFAPNDPNRPAGMPADYIKMPLLHEAEGLAVPYTVAERTADNELYTSPHMVATLLASAKIYQDLIAEFPELQGDMLRIRDQNSPAHRTHNDGRHADISGAFGFDVTQYATGAFADYQFSERFNKEFTIRMAEEMARLYSGGQPVIDKILSSGNTMVPEINQRVGRRFMVDFEHHEDHFHVQLRKDLALPQWRVRAAELPWSVDQDLRIAGMAQSITAEQHASQHSDFEAWVAEHGKAYGNPTSDAPVEHPGSETPAGNPNPELPADTEPLSPAAEEMINQLNLPDGHKDFLRRMLPSITTVYRTGAHINPAVVLAQTSLETGFGNDRLSPATNNFFGMKAGAHWTGDVFNIDTKEEYTAGDVVTITDGFRVYPSPAASVADYARLIQTSEHYADAAANYQDVHGYTNGLFNEVDGSGNIVKEQGAPGVLSYGTDRDYEQKVFDVIKRHGYEELVRAQLGETTPEASTTTQAAVTTTTEAGQTTTTTSLPEAEIRGSAWISPEAALKAYRVYFIENGEVDQEALDKWIDGLRTNEDGKVLVSIYNTPDMAQGEK